MSENMTIALLGAAVVLVGILVTLKIHRENVCNDILKDYHSFQADSDHELTVIHKGKPGTHAPEIWQRKWRNVYVGIIQRMECCGYFSKKEVEHHVTQFKELFPYEPHCPTIEKDTNTIFNWLKSKKG